MTAYPSQQALAPSHPPHAHHHPVLHPPPPSGLSTVTSGARRLLVMHSSRCSTPRICTTSARAPRAPEPEHVPLTRARGIHRLHTTPRALPPRPQVPKYSQQRKPHTPQLPRTRTAPSSYSGKTLQGPPPPRGKGEQGERGGVPAAARRPNSPAPLDSTSHTLRGTLLRSQGCVALALTPRADLRPSGRGKHSGVASVGPRMCWVLGVACWERYKHSTTCARARERERERERERRAGRRDVTGGEWCVPRPLWTRSSCPPLPFPPHSPSLRACAGDACTRMNRQTRGADREP
ncbi:hypothetical protein BC628DRAFT_1366325 [Trametes gibbosa]|nr:hypothetical protein BC628DRAFT_1366325 [Trametes gibbosa]